MKHGHILDVVQEVKNPLNGSGSAVNAIIAVVHGTLIIVLICRRECWALVARLPQSNG